MSSFAEFEARFEKDSDAVWQQIFTANRDVIKIKKEKFVIPNLRLIITSTITLSNRSGFRAMSLRDLSNDTGISMGALYSYIDSKKRLMEMILGHVLRSVETTLGAEEVARLAAAAEQARPSEEAMSELDRAVMAVRAFFRQRQRIQAPPRPAALAGPG